MADRISVNSSRSFYASNGSGRRLSVSSVDSFKSVSWVKYLSPDAATPELCPFSWKQIRSVIFPVEILLLLAMFCYSLFSHIYRQYLFQYIAKATTGNTTASFCLNQTYINSTVGSDKFELIQEEVNMLNMGITTFYLLLSGISSLILGPVSDVIGRKPVLFWVLMGLFFTSFIQLFVVNFDLDPRSYFAVSFFFGAFGGHAALIGLTLAAISDRVAKFPKLLTIRMGLMEAAITVALAGASAALNNWIDSNGCDFRPPVWLMFIITILLMVYIFLFNETLEQSQRSFNKRKLLNGLKYFLIPWYMGYSKWWRLLACTAIITLGTAATIGQTEIITYFLHNKPLEWSYGLIGIYEPIVAGVKGVCLIGVLPLFITLRVSNALLSLIASLVAVITYIMMATIKKTTWEMFLAGIIQGFSFVSFPAIRAILAQTVPQEDLGAIFTIIASIQIISSVGSTILYNIVYHPEPAIAGVVFWIAAAMWIITIPLALLLMCCKSKQKRSSIETKHLLANESQAHKSNNELYYGSVEQN
jgi:PCFT/HCP family folate transporter-like MFS transporter 1/3